MHFSSILNVVQTGSACANCIVPITACHPPHHPPSKKDIQEIVSKAFRSSKALKVEIEMFLKIDDNLRLDAVATQVSGIDAAGGLDLQSAPLHNVYWI